MKNEKVNTTNLISDVKTKDYVDTFVKWDPSMKATYKILIPDMLPWHFMILEKLFKNEGYDVEILKNDSRAVIDEGLKHVHNDTCYPCLCVVGQYIDALKSGKYDVDHTAVLITQSGGGCRASNYVPLIRKALKAEFPNVPVLSLNFVGLEKDSSLDMSASLLLKLVFAIFYGDDIMWCYNQTKPYEEEAGAADKVRDEMVDYVVSILGTKGFVRYKKISRHIIKAFASVKRRDIKKVKVGIVGEIYVKYSALGNNHLEDFLMSEDCEPVVPALMDFVLYCIVNNINDGDIYDKKSGFYRLNKLLYKALFHIQKVIIKEFEKDGTFEPLHNFEHLRKCADKVINQGVKMGEGWLIPAEMAALAETGTENIVCAQPFGCLPNHIAGKGVIRTLKNLYEKENIVAVDYDPSATKVNQENRIKLMLATARENLGIDK
ncbi:MAG: 2-hydroxyacyl-CoA dehydratase [Clostridia bacterium]|nr:2-hydroxyacyl-CoA dehydratase [Clostridia bacterium]